VLRVALGEHIQQSVTPPEPDVEYGDALHHLLRRLVA
jgi:hypothetical protein